MSVSYQSFTGSLAIKYNKFNYSSSQKERIFFVSYQKILVKVIVFILLIKQILLKYSIYAILYSFLVSNLVIHQLYTLLCAHHHTLIDQYYGLYIPYAILSSLLLNCCILGRQALLTPLPCLACSPPVFAIHPFSLLTTAHCAFLALFFSGSS